MQYWIIEFENRVFCKRLLSESGKEVKPSDDFYFICLVLLF